MNDTRKTPDPAQRGGGAIARLVGRSGDLIDRVPIALFVLVCVGAALRIGLDLSYRPAVLGFADSATYINMANDQMFADAARTVGYSIFLELAHSASNSLAAMVNIQHVLGIATGLLLYATVRGAGAPRWAALVGAGAVLLCLDQIYLEHAIASESVFTFLLVASMCAAVRSLASGRPLRWGLTSRELWLVAAGLLLGASAWVRAIGVPVIPFLALWVAVVIPGRWYARLARAGAVATPALALVLLYFVLNNAATGTFGLIQSSGWGIYSRTAQFADCSKFTPPEGTDVLCETKPSAQRRGPDFYSWNADSPAQRAFGYPPSGNEKVGEFGRAVLKAQPLDYVRAVGNDFLRYFFPSLNAGRLYGEAGYDLLEITRRDRVIEEDVRVNWVNEYWEPADPVEVTAFADVLVEAQSILRVHPLLLFQAAILALFGLLCSRGPTRATIVLLAGASVLMLGVAAATTYNARYSIPINGPLLAAGALGLSVLLGRYRARSALRVAGDPVRPAASAKASA